MFTRIKNHRFYPYFMMFKDLRAVGLVAFGIIVLLVSWSGINAIQSNYELQQHIAKLEQKNKIQELENENYKLKNQFYNTDEFLDISARRQFGKAAPGEKVLIVPKQVAMSHVASKPALVEPEADVNTINKPIYQKNFEDWINFILHRTK